MMNVAIIGSRDFHDYHLLKDVILSKIDVSQIDCVVSGGAQGADSLGKHFAKEHNINTLIFHPDWHRHGKAAGMIRNSKIINAADVVFAFWDGVSKGTKDSINKALKEGKEIYIIKCEIEE